MSPLRVSGAVTGKPAAAGARQTAPARPGGSPGLPVDGPHHGVSPAGSARVTARILSGLCTSPRPVDAVGVIP